MHFQRLSVGLLLAVVLFAGSAPYALGQTNTNATPPTEEQQPEPDPKLKAAIRSEDIIAVRTKTLFDASKSTLLPDGKITYRWDFTDLELPLFGKEVVREFERTGKHRVTLTVTQGKQKNVAEADVFVYDTRYMLVTDKRVKDELAEVTDQAANNGVYLRIVTAGNDDAGIFAEEQLVSAISEESAFLLDADGVLFYSRGSVALQAFAQYWNQLSPDERFPAGDKLWVQITDENLPLTADQTQQAFRVIQPNYILLTRAEALNPLFETNDRTHLTDVLSQRAVEFRVVDARSEKSRAFVLSHLVTRFVAQGIPINTVYLLLAFPFIMFVITFARQVVGISTLGIYAPGVIALALLILGIGYGLAVLMVVVIVSTILRLFLNRFNLMYVPKTSLVLSAIGLSFLAVMGFLSYAQTSLSGSLAIFPMLVMSTISEKFISAQSETGSRGAFFGVIRTIAVALVAYYLVAWSAFTNLLLSWPELVIVPFLLIILLGRFTGLRLMEYVRFRSLFREEGAEE